MKKLLLTLIILITTGCNSTEYNNLNCKKNEENITTEIKLEYLKNGKNLQKVNIITTIAVEEDLIDLINQDEVCVDYENYQGINCKTEVINNQYIIILDYDILNMSKQDIEKFDLENDQYPTTKENLEKENYSCE